MTSQIIPVEPFDFVIFGGTGDLSKRKLLPALFLRDLDGQLPSESRIIGVSRENIDDAGYREVAQAALKAHLPDDAFDAGVCERFLERLYYFQLDVTTPEGWGEFASALGSVTGRVDG